MVTRYIMEHLVSYPNAKDTTLGISQWWLPRTFGVWDEANVQNSLDVLVAKEWITQRQIIPTISIYGLNQDKLEEILEYLESFL